MLNFQFLLTLPVQLRKLAQKWYFFGLGPTFNTLRSTRVDQIHLRLISIYTQLPKSVQQSILASQSFGLYINIKLTKNEKKLMKQQF